MKYHLHLQNRGREAQYPLAGISSSVQREAIKQSLALPLAQKGCIGMAFRIIWRTNQDMVWKQIVSYRSACDRFLNNTQGVSMFVSSITGMVGKSAAGKLVNPGVAYWIVLSCSSVDPRAIVRNIQGVLHGQAEVKLLQEPPVIHTVDTIFGTLCTVMKDHNNSYVRRRMAEAQLEGEASALFPCRIVAQNNELATTARQAKENLDKGGVYVDILEY